MIILIILVSFYLEGILSNIINISFLIPLFTILSLIIIYPYLYNRKKNYFIICFIIGLLYDIGYTDTLFLNAIIFLLIGYIIHLINIVITNNWFNVVIISLFIITIYRIITYLVLIFINYITPNLNILINSILNSILINIIYIIVTFKITDRISRKKGIYKMN